MPAVLLWCGAAAEMMVASTMVTNSSLVRESRLHVEAISMAPGSRHL